MSRGRHWLEPTSTCEATPLYCNYHTHKFKTYNEALLHAIQHNKETGHLLRVEEIHTQMIDWEDSTNWHKDLDA